MRTLLMLGATLQGGTLQAAELHVGAGQERVLEVPRLRLARLVLEEGATLRLAPGLQQFELHADEAWIGRDGADGAPGSAGVNGRFLVQPQARP